MAENIDVLGGTVGKALEKGKMAVGEIMRITLGVASDFMTPEQIEKRKVLGTAPFIELEVGIPDTGAIFTKTFAYYGGNVATEQYSWEDRIYVWRDHRRR